MSQLGIQNVRQDLSSLGLGHLRSLRAALVPGAGTTTNPRSTGPREALCGLIPGWHEARHTYDWVY